MLFSPFPVAIAKNFNWTLLSSLGSLLSNQVQFDLSLTMIWFNRSNNDSILSVATNVQHRRLLIEYNCDKLFAIFLIHTSNYTAVTFLCVYTRARARRHKQASWFALSSSSLYSSLLLFPFTLLCMRVLLYVARRRRTHTWLLYVWKKSSERDRHVMFVRFLLFTTAWLGHISLLFVVHSNESKQRSYLFICFACSNSVAWLAVVVSVF